MVGCSLSWCTWFSGNKEETKEGREGKTLGLGDGDAEIKGLGYRDSVENEREREKLGKVIEKKLEKLVNKKSGKVHLTKKK